VIYDSKNFYRKMAAKRAVANAGDGGARFDHQQSFGLSLQQSRN
jgi:hypothetical protein